MALTDPQSVTIGSAISLPRTGQGVSSGVFTSADGLVRLIVSHNLGKRRRTTVRVEHRKVAANVWDSSVNAEYSMTTYVVIDWPTVGYTVAEAKQVVDGLVGLLAAGSGAIVTKVLGLET